MDPESEIEEALKAKNDPIYKWKGHRLLMRKRLDYIVKEKKIAEDLDYVRAVVNSEKDISSVADCEAGKLRKK